MKKIIISLIVAISPLLVVAQQKVAFVNSQEIMMQMPESKQAQKRLQELDAKYTKEVEMMQAEYTKKVEAFVKQQETLSEAIRKSRQQELTDMQARIQRSVEDMQMDVQKQQQMLLAPIQKKVVEAIKKVGDAEHCTYVVEAAMLLYVGKDAVNITPKVKTKLGLK